jgi:hypothetical protein
MKSFVCSQHKVTVFSKEISVKLNKEMHSFFLTKEEHKLINLLIIGPLGHKAKHLINEIKVKTLRYTNMAIICQSSTNFQLGTYCLVQTIGHRTHKPALMY